MCVCVCVCACACVCVSVCVCLRSIQVEESQCTKRTANVHLQFQKESGQLSSLLGISSCNGQRAPTRTMQWDLILLVQKPSEIMGPSSVSSSFSCMMVKGRVRCSTWRIRLGGFRAGDGVRCFTVV